MNKITKAGKGLVLILLVVTVNQLIAQTYQQDNFILKLNEGVNVVIQRGTDGLFDYGISELDTFNEQYGVIRMEKMFVDEVGNDLAQYYRVFLSEPRSDIAQISDSYQSLSSIEFVELQTVAELLDQNHPNDPLYNFSLNGGTGTQEQWYLYNDGDMNDDGTPDGLVRAAAGIDTATVRIRPRLLSDNGPCYLSGELKEYLKDHEMKHSRGRPYHPQTQGKIERYHRTMKNEVKLHHYYSPTELESAIGKFIYHYNNERYHESLDNVTPADVYFGRRGQIVTLRDKIKVRTLKERKRINLFATA